MGVQITGMFILSASSTLFCVPAPNLKGATTSEAFYVVCNSTNNTAVTVDNGEVHIEVGVALQYPAEFIVINLSQWTGGSNSIETN